MSVEITNYIGSTSGHINPIEVTGYFNVHPEKPLLAEGIAEYASKARYSGGTHYDTTRFAENVYVRTQDELLPIGEFADFAAREQPTRGQLVRRGEAVLATLLTTEENVVSEEAKTPALAETAA